MSEAALERAKGWCAGLGTVEDGEGSFVLRPAEGSTEPVEVGWTPEREALVVRSAVTVDAADVAQGPNAPTFGDLVGRFAMTRGGLLSASVAEDANGPEVRVELPVHEDGLSRHSFLSAIAEVRKATDGVRALVEDLRHQRALLAGLDAIAAEPLGGSQLEDPVPMTEPGPAPLADGVAAASPSAGLPSSPVAPAAAVPVAPVAPAAWVRSHVVPPGGMPAWDAADPTRQPIMTLQAGVELQVTEWLGAWAHVRASNAWVGWVDGRNLVPSP